MKSYFPNAYEKELNEMFVMKIQAKAIFVKKKPQRTTINFTVSGVRLPLLFLNFKTLNDIRRIPEEK